VTVTQTEQPPSAPRTGASALPVLAAHWHVAIDTAEAAVTASLRAELLPGDYCRKELEHLHDESRWLEHAPFS
jgi:hypothetical protein